MTWEDFQITAEYILSKEGDIFDGQPSLHNVKKTEAKRIMLNDLTIALEVTEDDAGFEALLTTRIDLLRQALSLLQLHLYFHEKGGDAYTSANMKASYYLKQYENMKSSFKNLSRNIVQQCDTVGFMR